MTRIVWLMHEAVDAIHDMQLTEHGGLAGVRDEGLLESALARPQNLHSYGAADIHALSASYAYGIAKNHP
jgi:death-on-curing protein